MVKNDEKQRGRLRYEKPELVDFTSAEGIQPCQSGSHASGNCKSGAIANESCSTTGNAALGGCGVGSGR